MMNIYWRPDMRCLLTTFLLLFFSSIPFFTVQSAPANASSGVAPSASATPVSAHPALTWPKVDNAVYYEVEFLSEPPEVPNGMNPSSYRTRGSDRIFTAGYIPDLEDYPGDRCFWRVQAYDLYGNPLSPYSDAREIRIDRRRVDPPKPLSTTGLSRMPAPLYPVYSWTPIEGVYQYEVEILKTPPDNPNGTELSSQRNVVLSVRGFSLYDAVPRPLGGNYYWRVRGLDGIGCPVGVFSDAEKVTAPQLSRNSVATFGDSLTHGGGALSHSPSEPEYSYQTYLDFPTINLGRSGDTTDDMLDRFSRDVLPFKPRTLLILGGTNDLRGGTAPQTVIHNLSELRDLCQTHGIRPVFLTIPPVNPGNIYRTVQADTAAEWRRNFRLVNDFIRQQRYYIDIAPALTDNQGVLPGDFSADGLHPDIKGKKKMAAVINTVWLWMGK